MEAIEYLVRVKGQLVWWLPEWKRRTMCLRQMAHRCRVGGCLAQGTRPHIADGSELGILRAQGAWGEISNDQKLRREITNLRGRKRLASTVPTVTDRLIQQALSQVLQPLIDPTFSKHSHGFRPGRRARDSVLAALQHVQDGYRIVGKRRLSAVLNRASSCVMMASHRWEAACN